MNCLVRLPTGALECPLSSLQQHQLALFGFSNQPNTYMQLSYCCHALLFATVAKSPCSCVNAHSTEKQAIANA